MLGVITYLMISDTTIAATQSLGTDLKDKF
jgi:hypothetical protein